MVDYIIIGAGVYGTATAWSLAQAGASVHIIDERDVATRASGGPGRRGVRANGRDVRELPLMREAYELWPDLHEQLGAAPFYERCGQLLLAGSDVDLQKARSRLWMQREAGIPTEFLSAAEVKEMEPGLGEGIAGALYCPDDGVAEHAATTRAFAKAAVASGVQITTHRKVSAVTVESRRARGVQLRDGERIDASRGVFVLTNSTAASLVAPFTPLPVWSECFQVLISEPMDAVPFERLTGHLSRTVSLKREGGNRVMISGGWRGRWDPVLEEGETTPEAVAANVREAVLVYPGLEGLRVETADASHQESLSIDEIPVIDQVPSVQNLWFAAGWCGHGWAIGPVVSRHLADWALTGSAPAPLRPFGLARFSI